MRTMTGLALAAAMTCSAATFAQAQGAGPAAPAGPVTFEKLMKFSPKADKDIVRAIVAQWPEAVAADVTKERRIHHLLAQLATETRGFQQLEENLNYTAKRLREVFPKRVTVAQARQLAGNKKAIANHVYGKRLGNDCVNDGWNFRGSGLIQLTGRGNFHDRSEKLKPVRALELDEKPLDTHPKRARSFPYAFTVAVSYWASRNANDAADRDELKEVRQLVNGGTNGLDVAEYWLARAKRLVPLAEGRAAERMATDSMSVPEQEAIANQLITLKYLPAQDRSSRSGPSQQATNRAVDNALRRFQRARGLRVTGQVDDDTLYELTDPRNFAEQKLLAAEAEAEGRAGRQPVDCVKMAVVEGD